MKKDLLQRCRNITYSEAQTLVTELSNRAEMPYVIPSALEAIICVSTNFFSARESGFEDEELFSFTFCEENVLKSQIVIGGSIADGLQVTFTSSKSEMTGVAPVYRL